ncbi:MAG: FtsW/RodA/SpoVE family cell cycle protein, partial [Thermoflexales bacterium]|nr:FtsW/RodA/SpoVE family cell cycle protein [Thermoflexales bacterium]
RVDYSLLRRYAVPIMLLGLASLAAVLLFGEDYLGARRTFLQRSIQPSEAAKLCLAIYAAAWLASRREQVRDIANGLVPFGVIVGSVAFLIVAQPDLSTAAVVVFMAFAMFFFAGASAVQMLLLSAIAAVAFIGLVLLFPYAMERLQQYSLVWADLDQASYHQRQMFIALGSGGLFGKGLGAGGQKFGLLPMPNHDSVTAVIGEELGLIGLLLTLALFGLFAWRGLVISQRADTAFGAFLAIGIVVWVVGQMLLHVLSVFALIPFGGMASPFLSQGGSSIVAVLAASGVLISIGRGSQMAAEMDNPIQGGSIARARVGFRRWNSRPRFARTYRVGGAPEDTLFGFRAVRRRTRGHGT